MRLSAGMVVPSLCALLSLLHSGHAHGSKHAAQASTALSDTIEVLEPQFFPKYNSERMKARFGPYLVPSMLENNGMISFGGKAVPPPCTDCLITYIHAGLEYPDGTTADASNGMWLHHTVWTNLARANGQCPGARHGDRFFASGNERTPVDLTIDGKVKAGYEVKDGDVIAMGGELMNMRHEEREVVLSMVFEFIPSIPKDFRKVKSYWLDVGGCGGSDLPAYEDKAFDYESPALTTEDDGNIVFTASHLHDGGVHSEIKRNGKVVCDSEASYGNCHHKGDAEEDEHISRLSSCTDIGRTKKGDKWSVTAYYNTTEHAPMRNMDGSLEPVMGISLIYVAVGEEKGGHKKLKISIGLMIVALSAALVVMWARLNGRDWLLRKNKGVSLGDTGKTGSWFTVERYRDEE